MSKSLVVLSLTGVDAREIEVRGMDASGSANITAVAGTVRGARNEVSPSSVEKIEIIVAPVNPETRPTTSANTMAF